MKLSNNTFTTMNVHVEDFDFDIDNFMELFNPDELDDFDFSIHIPSKSQTEVIRYFDNQNKKLRLLTEEDSDSVKQLIKDAFADGVDFLRFWVAKD